MDLKTIADALFWLASILSAGFLTYGGWLCLYHLTADHVPSRADETGAGSTGSHSPALLDS
jgi:hypothetical protein